MYKCIVHFFTTIETGYLQQLFNILIKISTTDLNKPSMIAVMLTTSKHNTESLMFSDLSNLDSFSFQ